HERRFSPPHRGAGRTVRRRGEKGEDGGPQGTSERRRHPGVDLQRRFSRVGENPRQLHARIREGERSKSLVMASRVLVSDTLSDAGLAILKGARGIEVVYKPGLKEAELAEAIAGFDALVIRSGSKVTAKVIDAAKGLKVIGRAGIGVDNVDVPAASHKGIVVMNTPTGNAVTTAEHALALLFSLARRTPQATASMRAGKWEKTKFQ